MPDKLLQYAYLMRLHKPIGILLLLWPTLWALWIAGQGHPDILVFWVFVAGVVLMRSAGCVINDYADRKIDPYVERTKNRPIAAGKVVAKEALILFAVLCVIAFCLVLLMNPFTLLLSFGAVILAASYPFMKRLTHLPQVYLGLAFAWAIPMAFAAQLNMIPAVAWILFVATVVWTVAYDTMYAMVDREDDLKIGVKSTAVLFGRYDRHWILFFQIVLILLLMLAGIQLDLGYYYVASIGVAILLVGYQQFLIKDREPKKCFQAFLNNQWLGAVVFLGLLCEYW